MSAFLGFILFPFCEMTSTALEKSFSDGTDKDRNVFFLSISRQLQHLDPNFITFLPVYTLL